MLEDIIKKLDDIKYGFIDKDNNIYTYDMNDFNQLFDKLYFLQSPDELIKNKYGVCFDQVELERYYLDKENIKSKSFFIVNSDVTNTHTFIVVKLDKYYWIEHAWGCFEGIHEYDSLCELLNDVKNKFVSCFKLDRNDVMIYEYSKPKYNIDCGDFINYCLDSKKVQIN